LLYTTPRPKVQPGHGGESDLAFIRLPVVWWCFAFFLLSTMTLAVIQNFSVPILKAMQNVSLETASMTLTAYMLCGAVGMLGGGFVAARFPRWSDRVVALCMTSAALLMAVCASGVFGSTGTLVVLAATGFAVGVGGPSRDLMIKKATPKGATGRVYGLVYSGLDVGFAVSPIIFGMFMDRGWYAATLLGAALVLLLSVGAALGVGKRTAHA
jgi:predicted MFS family arabinose efflux permease